MVVSFVLSFFPRGVLDEILNLIESVSEGFPSYSYLCPFYHSALTRGNTKNRYLCCRPSRYCVKLLSTEDYGFRPSSTEFDRGTTSLSALKVRYLSVYFYFFGVQTVSDIVCYV